MSTGRLPFRGKYLRSISGAILRERLQFCALTLKFIKLEEIIGKALEKTVRCATDCGGHARRPETRERDTDSAFRK
jgi:hypothetical protein